MAKRKVRPDYLPADHDRWDVELGGLMHDVARLRRVVFDKDMRPLNITRSHAWVLARLGVQDGISQVELADMLNVGKAALGSILDSLESAALIRRELHADDRRVRRVFMTESGTKAVRAMRKRLRPLSEKILTGISIEEREQLIETMRRIKENLLSMSRGDELGSDETSVQPIDLPRRAAIKLPTQRNADHRGNRIDRVRPRTSA